jgi:hypothetical protein
MSTQGNFKADLEFGKLGENRFMEYLKSKNLTPVLNEANDLKGLRVCDLYCNIKNKQYKFEVKTDRMAIYTGNICIEWNALIHSSATHWVFFIYDKNEFKSEFYVVRRSDLLNEFNLHRRAYNEKGVPLCLMQISFVKTNYKTYNYDV